MFLFCRVGLKPQQQIIFFLESRVKLAGESQRNMEIFSADLKSTHDGISQTSEVIFFETGWLIISHLLSFVIKTKQKKPHIGRCYHS